MSEALAVSDTVGDGEDSLDPEIIEAIKDGEISTVQEWLGTVGADSIDKIVDTREITYSSGDSDVSSNGMTALHYAAFYAQVQLVEMLLKAGADPRIRNADEENVLQCAIQSEEEDSSIAKVTRLLLEKRDDFVDYITESSQWSALLMAVYLNHPETVQVLLDHGADPAIDVKAGKDKYRYSLALASLHEGPILEMLLATGRCDVNWPDGKYTALHIATKFFKPTNVKILVDHKANMFVKDAFGNCPIHYCIGATSNADFESIVSHLKRSINEQDDVNGYTLMHSAVIHGKTEYVRILRHKFNAGYSKKDKQGRLPIHYLYNQSDIQDLVDLLGDSDNTINAKDKKGFTPLHYAVKKNDTNFVQCLIENGARADITAGKQKHWLIHLATIASGTDKDFETMVTVLKQSIREFNVSQPDANGRTPLHWALDMRKFSRGDTLLTNGADPSLVDCNLKNCLHIAFHRRCPGEVVKKMLKGHQGLDQVEDKDGNIPLQYLSNKTPLSAIKALEDFTKDDDDSSACVEITMEYKKKREKLLVPKSVSAEELVELAKKTFDRMDVAVQRHRKDEEEEVWEAVEGLLDLGDAEVFKVVTVAITKDTPLNQAIALDNYEMVKLLLVKGAVLDYETLQEAIVKEDEELALILVRHAKDYKTPLNVEIPMPYYIGDVHHHHHDDRAQSPPPTDRKKTTLFRELITQMPKVALEVLERCVSVKGEHKFKLDLSFVRTENEEGLNVVTERKCSDCCPPCHKKSEGGTLENPLELMVKSKRIELLRHPVVWKYLFLKWNALGFWFYFFKLFTFLLFLTFLSLFVLIVNDPQSEYCAAVGNVSNSDCGPAARLTVSYILAALVILLAIYHLVLEFFRLVYSPLKYFKRIQNYFELLIYFSCIIFVFIFANSCGCPKDWQWQIGIFAVFLAWMNFVFFAAKFPRTGIYVLVFKEILQTFLNLVAFGILLVIAFSLVLYMLFYSPVAAISSFSNIGHSFVKTMTMVTGELGFECLFNLEVSPDQHSPIPYYVSGFIMWIMFLILVPIILNNMLVSLAVGDAKEVIENAELQKLILQVKTVVIADEVVPRSIKNRTVRHIKPEMVVDSVEQDSYWNKLRLFIFGGVDYLQTLEDNTYAQRRKEEQEEIKGERVTDDENILQVQDRIQQKLDQVYDLVMTNEEFIKKCQKHDQNMMRIIGKLKQ